MSDQYRACAVCFQHWVAAPGEIKCPACDAGRIPNNTATKKAHRAPNSVPDEPTLNDLDAYLAANPG